MDESKIWEGIDRIAQLEQRHPDDVYSELMHNFAGIVNRRLKKLASQNKVASEF